MLRILALLILFTSAAWPAATHALDGTVSVGYAAEHTDNTARTETNEVDEWISIPEVSVGARHAGTAAELDMAYRYEHRSYEEDLFEDDDSVTGTTNLVWHALPERLDFNVFNARTELTERAIVAFTEANRQVVNVTQAGPTLRFRTRGQDELQFQYIYGDVQSEETDTDSTRHSGIARYIIQSSERRSFTVEGIKNEVQFENPAAPDIDAWTGQVNWTQRTSSTELSLTGGYMSMERTLNREDLDTPVVELDLTWDVGSNTQLQLTGGHDIRDQSTSLTVGTGDLPPTNSNSNEVFTNTRGEISLSQTIGRTDLTLFARYDDEDYEDVLLDNETEAVGFRVTRQLTPRMSFAMDATFGSRDFLRQGTDADGDENQDEVRAGMNLVWEAGKRLTLALGVRYEDREGDSTFSSYQELMGSLSIFYRLLGERPPVAAP